jgi:PAS domain S-box-containing protein
MIGFYWYFVEPVRTIYIYPSEIPYFIIFAAFAALISWFATIRRRSEAVLREQANLLSLTHDTIFVMDMEGVIKYWNRGAEERYGWTAGQALGRDVHELLKSVFPSSLDEIKAEVIRTGRWEGELVHTKKDGTQVVVASRWSLERSTQGVPVAILETNNDITERKRAEEALRRLNRELRAISNCNQTLLRATDEQSLLREICRIVCQEAGYRMAWVAYAEHDEAKSVRPVAWTGTEEGYLANLGITWADTERGRGPTGTAIRSGKTCCIQDFATDPRLAPWRENALQRDFRSAIALPLKDEHANAFGSLTIYYAQPNAFTSEEIRLLEELAADLAFGIVTLRSQAARQRAEQEVALLSFALDNVREAAFLIDDRGRFHYVNEEACRVLGYSRAELLGLRVSDIDPEFPAERWADHWRDLEALRSLSFESRHQTQDGRVFPVEVSANYLEYGGRAYNLALVRDISERKKAEQERSANLRKLQESEGNLNRAQEIAHIGSWHLDIARNQLTWSDEVYRMFGRPRDTALSYEAFLGAVYPEDRERVDRAWAAALQGAPYDIEHRILVGDELKWVRERAAVEFDPQGKAVEGTGSVQDVTERKRAEEALRQSEAYLTESQRLTHTGSWALDAATREYTYWSEEMFRIFGVDRQQGVPPRETMGRRIHPEDRIRAYGTFEKSLHEKIDTSDEYRFVLPSGTVKHVHVIRHPVLNAAGEVVELVGTFMDITERKRAQEALRQSEAYLAESQRLTHTGSWAFDVASNKYVYVSEECFRIFGMDAREGLPNREAISRLIHPEDWDRVNASFDNSVREKVDTLSEFRIVLPSGTVKHVHVIRHPVLNDAGDVVNLVGTVIDITERKRAEQERGRLHQLESDLAHINRVSMMGELAASIAHEVNQPLSGVMSNGSACLRWLAGDAPNVEEAREASRRIVRDGKRAGEVIARVRALTKRAATPREKLDLNETVREVLALVEDEAKRNSVNIRTQFADDLSPISGDRVQLQQVVLNLVMNAMEAMSGVDDRPRELLITTRNIDADQVQVTVKDSGPGIDPNLIDKIFDPFYTTKPGGMGMGMGLSISRSILQAHGGRLWAAAKDGPGTIFHFTVPKYREEESNAGA